MKHQKICHESWVDVQELQENLHPCYYAPVFRKLSLKLQNRPENYIKLEKYIKPALQKEIDTATIKDDKIDWIIRCSEDLIEVVRKTDAEMPGMPVIVPDNALIVCRVPGKTFQPALYWDQSVFRGNAATGLGNLIFTAKGSLPIAWIQIALAEETAIEQIRRKAACMAFPVVLSGDVLHIQVPLKSRNELVNLSDQVVHGLKQQLAFRQDHVRIGAKEFGRTHLIPGATLQDKLDNFEKLLRSYFSDNKNIFFVEAATGDPESDLFAIRPLFGGEREQFFGPSRLKPSSVQKPDANTRWRRWYWNGSPTETCAVFNSMEGEKELPEYLLARMTQGPFSESDQSGVPVRLLSFATIKDIMEANRDQTTDGDRIDKEFQDAWRSVNGFPIDKNILREWLDLVYRPVLALKAVKSNETAGVFLIFGKGQMYSDSTGSMAELRSSGEQLADALNRSIGAGDEIVRNESLRRLSWIMHQISGPAMRLRNGLEDLDSFLRKHPETAEMLIPDEESARRRAKMRRIDVSELTLAKRLEELKLAVMDLVRLRYQVRRFKNAHRELDLKDIAVSDIFGKLEKAALEQLPEIRIESVAESGIVCRMDGEIIYAALSEVVENACRELKNRRTENPVLSFDAEIAGGNVVLRIADNAFPEDCALPSDVFEEDASTYARTNQGTGLGLAIVRASFVQHGGRCRLDVNLSEDGTRSCGVTFTGELPYNKGDASNV